MKYFANKTIVLPFDFSESATLVIDEAIEMAEESTSIHVIHVVDPVPAILSVDPALPVPPSYDHGRYEQAVSQMNETFGKGEYTRLKIQCALGDPGSEIVDYANSVRANMIIMSSHGRTGISRIMLGSIAERVLRLSNCPVLIMRKPNQ